MPAMPARAAPRGPAVELKLDEMARMLGTHVVGKHLGRKSVGICTDSRALKKGQIFWALKGEKFDGHGFANEVFKAGGYAKAGCKGTLSPSTCISP